MSPSDMNAAALSAPDEAAFLVAQSEATRSFRFAESRCHFKLLWW